MQYGLNSFACLYSCFMISHNSKFSLPTPYFKFANDYFTECLHHLHFTVNTCDTLREKCPNTELFLVRIWTFFAQWQSQLSIEIAIKLLGRLKLLIKKYTRRIIKVQNK